MKQKVIITGENLSVTFHQASATSAPSSLTKAQARIQALKDAGVDVSMYFPLGDDKVIRLEGGRAVPVDMDDDTSRSIVNGGYIHNYRLFRRWVMAQMFHTLRSMDQRHESFVSLLQRKGYEYQWRMLHDELYAQVKMHRHGDTANYTARNRWFNAGTAAAMATHYISLLRQHIDSSLMWRRKKDGTRAPKHTCHGLHYVHVNKCDIFVTDLDKRLYRPLQSIIRRMEQAGRDNSPEALLAAVDTFNRARKKLASRATLSPAFIDAYKGAGAYYTMRNLILFHGARFDGTATQSDATSLLEEKTAEYANGEGWRLIGLMKQLIQQSDISIESKLTSWASWAKQ